LRGTLATESTRGQGTRLTVELPARTRRSEDTQTSGTAAPIVAWTAGEAEISG
jgi:hypothetical protein